jgi:c-di-GMP-binding flagellar brake protein YcgR
MVKDGKKPKRLDARKVNFLPGMTVLIDPAGLGKAFKTVFVGAEEEKYFLVRLPLQVELRDHLKKDKQVLVRFASSESEVCAFRTKVLGMMPKPYPLLFLEHPWTVDMFSLRTHNRVACLPPVKVYHDIYELDGVIMDISHGGCRIALEPKLDGNLPEIESGEGLYTRFKLNEEMDEFYLQATVRSVKKPGDKNKLYLGISFVGMDEVTDEKLSSYVTLMMDYQLESDA